MADLMAEAGFPEHEHLVLLSPVLFRLFRNGRTVRMLVPELDDMEAAAVHVEVDVALLEIRGEQYTEGMMILGRPAAVSSAFIIIRDIRPLPYICKMHVCTSSRIALLIF